MPPASIEPMTLTLGGLTALLHEQLSCFKISLPGVVAHVRHTFLGGDWSEKISMTIISLPLIQKGQLSVTGERMCTNDTGKLPRRLAWEQCG